MTLMSCAPVANSTSLQALDLSGMKVDRKPKNSSRIEGLDLAIGPKPTFLDGVSRSGAMPDRTRQWSVGQRGESNRPTAAQQLQQSVQAVARQLQPAIEHSRLITIRALAEILAEIVRTGMAGVEQPT